MDIGKRIRKLRMRQKMSQAQLARALKVTPAAISQFESGVRTPTSKALATLAQTLNVSTDYLLGLSEDIGVQDFLLDREILEFLKKFRQLSEEERKNALSYLEFLSNRVNSGN